MRASARRTFYHCDCPDLSDDASDIEYIQWLFEHYRNCKPRAIVNLYLPAFTDEDE